MDFEYIDESEIEFSRTQRKKVTPSLYDTPLADRTYWGNDPGTEIAILQMRTKIRRAIMNCQLLDIDDTAPANRLSIADIDDLWEFQMKYLFSLVEDGIILANQNDDGQWVLERVGNL